MVLKVVYIFVWGQLLHLQEVSMLVSQLVVQNTMSYLLMRTKSVSISSQRTKVKLANLCSSAAFAKSSFGTFASSWNTFGNTWGSPHTAANTVINVSTLTPHLPNTWQGFTKLVQTGWRCALQLRFHHFTNVWSMRYCISMNLTYKLRLSGILSTPDEYLAG